MISPDIIDPFESGGTISVTGGELPEVEELLIQRFLPPHPEIREAKLAELALTWGIRDQLHYALVGKKFNGRLENVDVTTFDNAYDELIAEKPRFTRLSHQDGVASTLGFLVTASLISTANKRSGELAKRVWIVRTPLNRIRKAGSPAMYARHIGVNQSVDAINETIKRSTRRAGGYVGVSLGSTAYKRMGADGPART